MTARPGWIFLCVLSACLIKVAADNVLGAAPGPAKSEKLSPDAARHSTSSLDVAGGSHTLHQWHFPKRPGDDDELVIAALELPDRQYALKILDIQKDGIIQSMLKASGKDPILLTNGGFSL